ncbi:MAG: putative Ig domain-containing protein [Halioglobus sp.]|nr:putative Ig domain-containing protein [Halioglobus sp.]
MKCFNRSLLAASVLFLGAHGANGSTAYGTLNNFDTVNDTGQECHGFEIEIEDVRSTDITYTYDWNHYGPPRITEDLSNPAHPKVLIRYESAKNPNGTWAAYTAVPTTPIKPTNGHSCTNPNVNEGCEHFGVGFYGAPTAVRYNWLVDNGGVLVRHTSPVLVGTPTWTYQPPVGVQPARVVAVIPAPEVEVKVNKEFGEPSFVKVIKTTLHNANDVALGDLVSEDRDADGKQDWQNGEPAQIETEFKLLQPYIGNDPAKKAAKAELQGQADVVGDGSENVTRRYEFYKYNAAANTIDGENGEAMCDEVNPTTNPANPKYLHGIGTEVEVTDMYGESYFVNCAAQVVVGEYIGAQMAGFDAALPLGLIDNLQDGKRGVKYVSRSVVIGGTPPYNIAPPVGLPPGLTLGGNGVLSGTPASGGVYNFTVAATDAANVAVSGDYTLRVTGAVATRVLSVQKPGTGTGTVTGNGIDCGANCSVTLNLGTQATLIATPAAGSKFAGWSGACVGTASCVVTLNANTVVNAQFDLLPPGC